MKVCAVCKIRYVKGSGITFHKFPTNSTKQLWLKNMKMENWSPNDRLCSKHFTENCFVKHATRTALNYGSVPTIFFAERRPLIDIGTFSENTISVRDNMVTPTPCVVETAGVKRKLSSIDEASTRSSQKKVMTIHEVNKNVDHDHHYEDRSDSEICKKNIRHDHRYESSPRSTKKNIQQVKKSLIMSRARVKALSQHVKRLKITVSSLKTIITDLKKKKLINDDCVNMLDQYHDFRPELFKRMFKNTGQKVTRFKYPPVLRSFAVTK